MKSTCSSQEITSSRSILIWRQEEPVNSGAAPSWYIPSRSLPWVSLWLNRTSSETGNPKLRYKYTEGAIKNGNTGLKIYLLQQMKCDSRSGAGTFLRVGGQKIRPKAGNFFLPHPGGASICPPRGGNKFYYYYYYIYIYYIIII